MITPQPLRLQSKFRRHPPRTACGVRALPPCRLDKFAHGPCRLLHRRLLCPLNLPLSLGLFELLPLLHADSTIFSSALAAGRCASTAFRFWTSTTRAAACRRDKIGMVGGDKLVKSSGAYTWTWRKFALRRNAVHLLQRNRLPKIERKAHTVVRSLSVITRTCGRRPLGNKVADARLSPHPRKRGHDRAESFAREPL